MKFDIKMQQEYSRGELLLRTMFGFFYILIPHGLGLLVFGIASAVIGIIAFFSILINNEIPQNLYDFQVKYARWGLRVRARMMNMRDGYPAFGMDGQDDGVVFEMTQPAERNKMSVILRFFFGVWYVMIPHGFCLYFLSLGMMIVQSIQFWIILITGKANEGMYNYCLGVMRWGLRVNNFMGYLTDEYPPFSLDATPEEKAALGSSASSNPFA